MDRGVSRSGTALAVRGGISGEEDACGGGRNSGAGDACGGAGNFSAGDACVGREGPSLLTT